MNAQQVFMDEIVKLSAGAEIELPAANLLHAAYNAIADEHAKAMASQAPRGMNPWLKAGLIGLPATGAAAGGVYLIHKLLKRRKQQGA